MTTNKERLQDAYEKLRCFQNPLLHEIADDIQQVCKYEFGGLDGIIQQVADNNNVSRADITSPSRKPHLVQLRVAIAKRANQKRYTQQQIAYALNRDASTISDYLSYD